MPQFDYHSYPIQIIHFTIFFFIIYLAYTRYLVKEYYIAYSTRAKLSTIYLNITINKNVFKEIFKNKIR